MSEGREEIDQPDDEVHVRFDMGRKFARAYYRDEMKAKGLKSRFSIWLLIMTTQKEIQNIIMMKVQVNKFLGFNTSSNDDKSVITPVAKWENDFKLMGNWNILLSDQDNSKLMRIL